MFSRIRGGVNGKSRLCYTSREKGRIKFTSFSPPGVKEI